MTARMDYDIRQTIHTHSQHLCSVHASWFSDTTPQKCQRINPEMKEIYFHHLVQWA